MRQHVRVTLGRARVSCKVKMLLLEGSVLPENRAEPILQTRMFPRGAVWRVRWQKSSEEVRFLSR